VTVLHIADFPENHRIRQLSFVLFPSTIILRIDMSDPVELGLSRRDFLYAAIMLPGLGLAAQSTRPSASAGRFVDYSEVESLLRSGAFPLPPGLTAAAWPRWVRDRDAAIRARVQKGEEDTLANFVLFGVSFTNQKRLTPDITNPNETDRLIRARVQSFVDALSRPGNNERLALLGSLIKRLGYGTTAGETRERLSEYVMNNVMRYLAEQQGYEKTVTRSLGNDTVPSFNTTAELYKDRGLSVDTDFRPNYAIENALAEVKRRGLLRSVRRVAVIGPGLDFTDKDSGFDHYPLQTLQPFAVVDSLLKLGLARSQDLRVSLFDISVPTLDHISKAVARARAGQPYALQLVLDRNRQWNRSALEYWQRFGVTIGSPVTPLPLPSQITNADRRALSIRPEIVALMEPLPINIVLQRQVLRPEQQYDLVIGTNVLIYYDGFEQALALSNIDAMTASGGVFLTNDLSRNYPGTRLRPSGIVRVDYSAKQADQVQIYARSTFQPQLPPA
jgi:hypothetical protein